MADLGGRSGVGRIWVVRALMLGDLLCAVPFLRALRRRHPGAHVTLVGLPWAIELVRRLPGYLDDLVPFPGWPGIPEVRFAPTETGAFLRTARAAPPDLAIQLHGSGVAMNDFVAALRARHLAGFVAPGRTAPDGIFVPYPGTLPEVRRHLQLAVALGGDASDERLELQVLPEDRRALAVTLAGLAPLGWASGAPYAVLHQGASNPVRRWAPARFAAIADHLAERGIVPVLTGIAAERRGTAEVIGAMRHRPVDVTGQTSLGALIALVSGATVVVSNDTGISHLADALGRPSVTLFLASDPRRWAPLDGTRHVAVVAPDLGRRCAGAGLPGHADCLLAGCVAMGAEPAPSQRSIEVAAVRQAVDELLGRLAPSKAAAARSRVA